MSFDTYGPPKPPLWERLLVLLRLLPEPMWEHVECDACDQRGYIKTAEFDADCPICHGRRAEWRRVN